MTNSSTDDKSRRKGWRAIPPIDDVLSHPSLGERRAAHPKFPWTSLVRSVVDDYREMPEPPAGVDGSERESVREWILAEVIRRFEELRAGGQRRVI
ncbi:MAG: hypothetical protein KAJ17_08850, partial [Candidatus Krumholzibacteria bacterium]|nr:hypothetical protein [Candidatus Krumholzibacteria bacterium]